MHVYEPTSMQGNVLRALDPDQAVSIAAIAERAGITIGAARSRLAYLELKHCVVAQPKKQFDRNWWVLTSKGSAHRERLLAEVAA